MIKRNAASTSKSKYLMSKFDDKILSYGIQANVADFAYAKSRKDYLKKNFGQHFGTFVFGGLGGALQGHAMGNPMLDGVKNRTGKVALRLGLSTAAYGIEYVGASSVKANYLGTDTYGWPTKLGVSVYKALMYSLFLK